jgi:hypothetical protein
VGTGPQEVEVAAEAGDWVAVVMPADGTPGLQGRLDIGATLPWLPTAATVMLTLGLALIAAGAVLVTRGTRVEPV